MIFNRYDLADATIIANNEIIYDIIIISSFRLFPDNAYGYFDVSDRNKWGSTGGW